jgi:hypothetical protein
MTYECFVRRGHIKEGVTGGKRTRTQKPRKLVYKRHHCLFHTKTHKHTLTHFHLVTYLLRNNPPHTNTHHPPKHAATMSSGGNTVNVKGISHETTEKEVRDFFSFW